MVELATRSSDEADCGKVCFKKAWTSITPTCKSASLRCRENDQFSVPVLLVGRETLSEKSFRGYFGLNVRMVEIRHCVTIDPSSSKAHTLNHPSVEIHTNFIQSLTPIPCFLTKLEKMSLTESSRIVKAQISPMIGLGAIAGLYLP